MNGCRMLISALDSLRSDPMIRFKEEELDTQTLTIVHYMISNSELWNNPAAYEARGNVYNEKGECICACFKKFFNVNERPETRVELIKNRIIAVQEKKDGSLVAPVISKMGRLVFKTKKSFTSDVALLANACVPANIREASRQFILRGHTPLFEFTHPDAKIVLDYGTKPTFTLLAVRSFLTGDELTYSDIQDYLAEFNLAVPLIPSYSYSWTEVKDRIENEKGIEGFVLILDDGSRVKIKTEEYLRLHRIHTEIRERDIAEAVIDETLDDILGVVVQSNLDRSKVDDIEAKVVGELTQIQREVDAIIAGVDGLSIKEIALGLQKNPLFSLIMTKIRGKEPNYIEFWKKNYLKNYSLRCVYNQSF